jgi:predicted metal-dependent HD superfamily phosphohydrolase
MSGARDYKQLACSAHSLAYLAYFCLIRYSSLAGAPSDMKSKPGEYGIESVMSRAVWQPGYWKTLKNLRRDNSGVELQGSALRFTDYPFEPASVFPSGTVEVDRIADVDPGRPSEVRLTSGEILFVKQADKEPLLTFVNQHDIRLRRRSSVWSALLDPFLDSWQDQESIDRQFEWFASVGLHREAIDAWRREVAVAMMAYNFGTHLWEWGALDLYDVLTAQRARLDHGQFADFYWRAMRVAELDPVLEDRVPTGGTSIENELYGVLLEWYPREKSQPKDFEKEWDKRRAYIEQQTHRLAAELKAAYSEPHRRYHTLAHVEKCLAELRSAWFYAVHLHEIEWALLFHDVVYDPRRQDNEARSADWACRVMDELRRPEDEKARVRSMILATAHSAEPRTPDEALLLDADLSILGADEAVFDEYDRAVRVEYAWVPEQAYRNARAQVLRSFLSREPIYHTALFRGRYEEPARANLRRALARLENG